jgi:Xaa-Pro aminopeptidase
VQYVDHRERVIRAIGERQMNTVEQLHGNVRLRAEKHVNAANPQVARTLPGERQQLVGWDPDSETLYGRFRERNDASVVLDETMRADFALLLLDALPGARRRFTQDTVGYLRSRKDEDEYKALKASALLNDEAMQAAFAALKPSITEREVAEIIGDFYKANGAVPEFISVCFGGNGAFPHHHTGETRLKQNDPVLIDIGGRIGGYPSDMTRVAHTGTSSSEFDWGWSIVDEAVRAAIAAAKPGARAKDVDKAARDVIAAAGYGEHFLHRTGHGLGIDIHEAPYITAASDTVLEDGMVFSIEPGIYLAGRFGIRLEEIVIIRTDGAEILSELPREAVQV